MLDVHEQIQSEEKPRVLVRKGDMSDFTEGTLYHNPLNILPYRHEIILYIHNIHNIHSSKEGTPSSLEK